MHKSRDFGINLFGQFSSATGLGVLARHTAYALRYAKIPFVGVDIDAYYPAGNVNEELEDISQYLVSDSSELIYPVNLYCIPVIDAPELVKQAPQWCSQPRFHAAVALWETTKLHTSWTQALSTFDALVVYSEFLSGILANSLSLTPILTGHQPLFLPDRIKPDRAAFGLPNDATVFINSFDPSSDPARKNPGAIITSFRHAFPKSEDNVHLLFRLNNAYSSDMARQTTQLLIDAAADDNRISFALEPMTYKQALSLYASANVYISLHRAEGLGLSLLEAMNLGLPVIATAWSGNMTFMDHRCAALVRYQLAPISGNHPFYKADFLGADALWADPVIKDAIAWMQHLHRNPDERRRLGELARLRAERYQEEALKLDWLYELAEIWRSATQLPQINGKLSNAARKS